MPIAVFDLFAIITAIGLAAIGGEAFLKAIIALANGLSGDAPDPALQQATVLILQPLKIVIASSLLFHSMLRWTGENNQNQNYHFPSL